jgi:hypothetical protein
MLPWQNSIKTAPYYNEYVINILWSYRDDAGTVIGTLQYITHKFFFCTF